MISELNSINVLRDGETFEPTTGSIVVLYDEESMSEDARDAINNGDPRPLVGEVMQCKDENTPQRVLSVGRLVDLYLALETALDSDESPMLPTTVLEAMRLVESQD